MLLRRLLLLALALTLAAPALGSEGDPLAVVRELYRVHGESEKTKQLAWQPPHRERFFTRELGALIAAAYERNAIDFDWAEVEARFKNFGKPQRVVYELVQERGAWRISNIRQGRANGWILSRLLRKK